MMALAGAFLHQGKRICLKDGCYRSLSRILEIPSSRSSSVGAAIVVDWVVPLKLRFLEAVLAASLFLNSRMPDLRDPHHAERPRPAKEELELCGKQRKEEGE